jgi:hypothetical protein
MGFHSCASRVFPPSSGSIMGQFCLPQCAGARSRQQKSSCRVATRSFSWARTNMGHLMTAWGSPNTWRKWYPIVLKAHRMRRGLKSKMGQDALNILQVSNWPGGIGGVCDAADLSGCSDWSQECDHHRGIQIVGTNTPVVETWHPPIFAQLGSRHGHFQIFKEIAT